jgi:hypothetical protein
MAKDPAILFYPDLFLTGTRFFSWEQKGKYIELLLLQHQHGGMLEKEDFDEIVGDDRKIRRKFTETDDGYFNERMMSEMVKRQKKSTNLSANAKIRWAKVKELESKSNAIASTAHMPSKDRDKDKDKDVSKDYNIEELKNYLHAELPELGLDAPLVSSMQFDLIDSFISECEVFKKLANWKIYVERIKESDWLMRRTTGKGQKKTKMGLKWLCKADTVRDVMAGNHDNVDTVSDGREWL